MHKQPLRFNFQGPLSTFMEKFIRERLALGYRCAVEAAYLQSFDQFATREAPAMTELARPLVEKWTSKRSTESSRTHKNRIWVIRQFARFLIRQGCRAFVPDKLLLRGDRSTGTPYVFRQAQVRQLLAAADRLPPDARSPMRHLIMPEVFRVLYGSGMRLGEVLALTVETVDLDQGVLTVIQGKFRKDRLVPLHPSLVERLRKYAKALGNRDRSQTFFPAPDGGPYHNHTVYLIFRQLLWECGIPHGGRGRGPRIHDLRHSFACHRLAQWYRDEADLGAKLPLLAAYLGHQSLTGTQRYLHLTAEVFPDIAHRVEKTFGHVIPRRAQS